MKILINYADSNYEKTQRKNTKTAYSKARFDKVISYGPDDIDSNYKSEHADILNVKRGNGLWLWKPYFINRVLSECSDGDYVFYCDSGAFFIRDIDLLIRSMRRGEVIWVSDNPLIESCFTKPQCFEYMNCTDQHYYTSNQIQGTYLLLKLPT